MTAHVQPAIIGYKAEMAAEQYLQQQGLITITRNFRCRMGEIDLIMQDNSGTLVFVEVRFRRNTYYGGPLSSIDYRKCRRLVTTAQVYVQKYPYWQQRQQRFDVVGITLMKGKAEYSIEWLRNAIEAC